MQSLGDKVPLLDKLATTLFAVKGLDYPIGSRKALIELGWPIGPRDSGFGRYECIENRMQGSDRVYAAGSEVRADAVALAY